MYLIDTHTRRETHFFSHPDNKDHVRPQACRNIFKTSGGKLVQCETEIRYRLGYWPKVSVSEPIFFFRKPKLFSSNFTHVFPNSWGNTSFYKLENKPRPSKIILKYLKFGRKLVLGALMSKVIGDNYPLSPYVPPGLRTRALM